MERRSSSSMQFAEWSSRFRQDNISDKNLEQKIRFGYLFSEMSNFPTVSKLNERNERSSEYYQASDEFLQFIHGYVDKMGEEIGYNFVINPVMEDSGVKSLVIGTHPGKEADFAVINHYDVAPPYFSTTFEGEKVQGRGVADMRGSIVIGLEALRELGIKAARGEAIPQVSLWLTGDEETGGDFGTKHVVAEGYRAKTIINLDNRSVAELFTGSKGIQKLTITAEGLSAHGSRPWLGFDPTEVLFSAFGNTFEKSLREGWEDMGTTMTIAMSSAGQAENSSPLTAMVTLDCRFSDPEEGKQIFQIAKERVQKEYDRRIQLIEERLTELSMDHPQREVLEEMVKDVRILREKVTAKEGAHSDVFIIDENDAEVQRWLSITESVLQRPARRVIATGGSDSEYTIDVAQHQILSAIPTAEGAHSNNERISLSGMIQMSDILNTFLGV